MNKTFIEVINSNVMQTTEFLIHQEFSRCESEMAKRRMIALNSDQETAQMIYNRTQRLSAQMMQRLNAEQMV